MPNAECDMPQHVGLGSWALMYLFVPALIGNNL